MVLLMALFRPQVTRWLYGQKNARFFVVRAAAAAQRAAASAKPRQPVVPNEAVQQLLGRQQLISVTLWKRPQESTSEDRNIEWCIEAHVESIAHQSIKNPICSSFVRPSLANLQPCQSQQPFYAGLCLLRPMEWRMDSSGCRGKSMEVALFSMSE